MHKQEEQQTISTLKLMWLLCSCWLNVNTCLIFTKCIQRYYILLTKLAEGGQKRQQSDRFFSRFCFSIKFYFFFQFFRSEKKSWRKKKIKLQQQAASCNCNSIWKINNNRFDSSDGQWTFILSTKFNAYYFHSDLLTWVFWVHSNSRNNRF